MVAEPQAQLDAPDAAGGQPLAEVVPHRDGERVAGAGAASAQGELPRQHRPVVGGGARLRGTRQVVAAVAPRERIGVAQLGEHA